MTSRSAERVLLVALCWAFAACRDAPPTPTGAGGAPAPAGSPPAVAGDAPVRVAGAPLARDELATTDGAIALGNLEAQITGQERLAKSRPLTVAERVSLAELLATRGRLLGRITDYERAQTLAETLAEEAPRDAKAILARARSRATFHRFDEALADLDAADRLGTDDAAVARARASVLQALGRYDEALRVRERAGRRRPDVSSLGEEATLRAARGELEQAERLFAAAPRAYRDVSPIPIAWLYFQEGLVWMREDQPTRAHAFFAAAHDRLPAYVEAQGHLAEIEAVLGRIEEAVALLRPLAESVEDPDYAAQLARILETAGREAEARPWREHAAARYEALVARHPAAFADHAAEFWVAAGHDPAKSLALATQNAALRPTARAYELVLRAARAAADDAALCAGAEGAARAGYLWPSLRALADEARAHCALARRQ